MTDNNQLEKIVELIKEKDPIYLKPHKEPKVWGRDGIGEYWYGAEAGDKSSIAIIGDASCKMCDLLNGAQKEILGEKATGKFGDMFPLVKILTPKGRLSVQFHDAKNELWIVTGIDEEASLGSPCVIVGFSPLAVKEHGAEVKKAYGEALTKYGDQLNALLKQLEDKGHKEVLDETKDILIAGERVKDKDSDIQKALDSLISSKEKVNSFYHYRTVKIGDVIPVPSGTLHALGAGVEVVEPQIAGSTQSTEDGETYPIRYYFPGYQTPQAQKKLDVERVGELNEGVVEDAEAKILTEDDKYTIEQLPGGFEDKGLEVHRIIAKESACILFSGIESFHNLVVVTGSAKITINGKEYDIPKAVAGDEMLIVPAISQEYKIVMDANTQIVDTFIPV